MPETTYVIARSGLVLPVRKLRVDFSNIVEGTPSETAVTITWDTDLAASSQIAYGTTTALGLMTVLDATEATSHSQTLSGLTAGTTYYYQLLATRNGKVFRSPVGTFDTESGEAPPDPVALPQMSVWEARMTSTDDGCGGHHANHVLNETYDDPWPVGHELSNNWYTAGQYDGQRVWQQIAAYTGNSSWLTLANKLQDWLVSYYVINNGNVPGYYVYSRGLADRYLADGNAAALNALNLLRYNSPYARERWDETFSEMWSREIAYALQCHIDVERCGFTPSAWRDQLLEFSLNHVDIWTGPDGLNQGDEDGFQPFMGALICKALIYYWEQVSQDARILTKVKAMADFTWANCWKPATQAFYYAYHDQGEGSPVNNLLIAPVWSWLYLQTGDTTYRDNGDLIWAGGITGTDLSWFPLAKQFNQNYIWSFDYVTYRQQAEAGL